jgi:hypothetical protein
MGLNPGDQICYRIMPEITRYRATILSCDGNDLVLRLAADSPALISRSQYIMISEPDTDVEHYSEVTASDGQTLQLRRMWTGKRGYFRVDDVFPVIHRKVSGDDVPLESRIFSGFGLSFDELEVPDESIHPQLWKMLVDMNAKLGMILEHLNLEGEGITRAESIPVNISASGIRFTLAYRVEIGDILQLKMLLPVNPPVGVLLHGAVVRVEELDNGNFGTSLRFVDLVDEVRDIIIQYALKRQREILRRQRRWDQAE